MATISWKVTKVNRNYMYCKRNIGILGSLQPSFIKFNHLRNAWTITHGCLSRTYTSSRVCLSSLERSSNFQKASFIKERSYQCCLRRAIVEEGRNIWYEMQELLRKVKIYIQNLYYAGNIFFIKEYFNSAKSFLRCN